MITNERLNEIVVHSGLEPCDAEPFFEGIRIGELVDMARELICRRKVSEAEKSIGVWNPLVNEIAVSHKSGIKIVDFAHWHCHCTMEVVVRDMSDHPLVKARKESS